MAATLLLGACGIKGDAAAEAGGDFCDQARSLAALDPELPESPEAVRQVADQFDRLAASAPSEIDDDMEFLADVYRQVTENLAESGGDDPEDLFAAAAPFFAPENAERLESANANVERYMAEECGIDPDAGDESTTTSVADTTTTSEDTTTTSEDATTTTSEDDGDDDDALPPGQPPGDLGDDPALDALAEQCFEGDMEACDALFFQSEIDSAYEEYGDTCGGRNEPMGLCTDVYGTD